MSASRRSIVFAFAGLAVVGISASLTAFLPAQNPAPARGGPIKATPREQWRTLHVAGSRMGYVHNSVTTKAEDGKTIVVTVNRVVIEASVPGRRSIPTATARSVVTITTEETEDGQLLAFSYEMANPRPLPSERKVGRWEDGKLVIESSSGKRTAPAEVVLPAGTVGPGYADRMLIQTPLKPGETRTITTFDPRTGRPDTVRLTARDLEPVLLADGTERRLLHVVSTHDITEGIEIHEFLDEAGHSLKTTIPSQEMIINTVPKDTVVKAYPSADRASIER